MRSFTLTTGETKCALNAQKIAWRAGVKEPINAWHATTPHTSSTTNATQTVQITTEILSASYLLGHAGSAHLFAWNAHRPRPSANSANRLTAFSSPIKLTLYASIIAHNFTMKKPSRNNVCLALRLAIVAPTSTHAPIAWVDIIWIYSATSAIPSASHAQGPPYSIVSHVLMGTI